VLGYLPGMTLLTSLGRTAASGGGAALGAVFGAAGALRPAAKPLHPLGRVVRGRLTRHGAGLRTGVPFLDEPGEDGVLARESRSVGLPGPLPDIQGLAVRVTNPDGSPGDLLLASTGWGAVTRFVLTPSATTWGRPMTTLFPYRTAAGPLLVGARSGTPGIAELAVAVGTGSWHPFAVLSVSDEDCGDPTVSFDPVLNQVPGLEQYPAVVRLREPAYRSARRTRGDS
jgi:hypothetical protein